MSTPNDPFYLFGRGGTKDSPFKVYNEPLTVFEGRVILSEVPHQKNHVVVKYGATIFGEAYDSGALTTDNVYFVDYSSGTVYFNNIHNGKQLTFTYTGEGYYNIPARRVYTQSDNGEPTQNIQDMIDNYNQLNGTDLYNLFDPQKGHKHTGASGDAPPIDSLYVNYNDQYGLITNVNDRLIRNDNQLYDLSINVTVFGAKGDGISDDSSAISNAISFANANGFNTIFFPKGNYLIINALTLSGGLNYVGQGATIKLSVATSYLNVVTQSGFILDGLTFDANNAVMYALSVTDSSKFTIRNCTFQNATKYGLYLHNAQKAHIEKCFAGVNGRNDFMSSGFSTHGTNIIFRDCEASGNTKGNGFIAYSDSTSLTSNITYIGCLAKGNAQHGFSMGWLDSVSNRVNYLSYIGCTADSNGNPTTNVYSGFSLADCYNSLIEGCIAINNQEHGIVLMDANNVTVSNNLLKGNKHAGIRLQADWSRPQDTYSGVKQAIISNNNIISNGMDSNYYSSGILIEGNNHFITCESNMLFGNYNSIFNKTIGGYTDNDNIYLNQNVISGQITSDAIQNTSTGSIFGENFIMGVRTKIDTILIEQPGYQAFDLVTDSVLDSNNLLNVTNNSLYHALTGENPIIFGVQNQNMPTGTKFYVCYKSESSSGSITIKNGNGITTPGAVDFVINTTNNRQEYIFQFVKTAGTTFRLIY